MITPQHALVLGLGRSGRAAARLLLREGADVTVVDSRDTDGVLAAARELRAEGARVLPGCGDLPPDGFDLAVVSPGISEHSDWVYSLRAAGIPYVSELELGWSRLRGRTLAITGSLGKTTATIWCHDALQRSGYRALLGGNIGIAVSELAMDAPAFDWLVLEVSSFQLETVRRFRPDIGLLTNIFPNHLDRHGTMDRYVQLKTRLFDQTLEADLCLIPQDWFSHVERACRGRGERLLVGGPSAPWSFGRHAVLHEDEPVIDLSGTRFDNPVLAANAAGVAAALVHAGVSPAVIEASLRALPVIEHRLQPLGTWNGIPVVNDSKATCLSALSGALRMLPGRKRLIAGGLLKERDLAAILPVLRDQAAALYLIGTSAESMAESWSEAAPCALCGTLDRAVERCFSEARPGETILFSPGCASFDQFHDYEARGRAFAAAVAGWVRAQVSPAGWEAAP